MFSLDIADESDLSGGNYFALRGHLDFWDDSTFSGATHVGALSAYVENESTTTVGSGTYLYGLDVYQVGAITNNGTNPAINIRSSAAAANWQYGLYINGATMPIYANATAIGATGRIAQLYGAMAAGNLGDGYGAVEIDLTATGTIAGFTSALSAWINVTGTGAVGSNIICAQTNGIYADSGANTGSIVIFGMRASGILTDAPTVFAPFSINTSNRAITALFEMNSNPDVGYLANSGTSGAKVGDVPLFCDAAGQQYFVRIYSARG